jgi:heme/copper-type cytochrome/quinol oxidase subunit 2
LGAAELHRRGGEQIDSILNFIFWLTLFVFIAGRPFWSSILSSIVAGRARLLHYSHGNNFLQVVWTTIPVLIFLGLAIYSNRVWAELHSDPALDALQINVLAFRMNGQP